MTACVAIDDVLMCLPCSFPLVQTMRRLPPQVAPRSGRKPPKIVLPTDRLYKIRDARNPAGRNQPYFVSVSCVLPHELLGCRSCSTTNAAATTATL